MDRSAIVIAGESIVAAIFMSSLFLPAFLFADQKPVPGGQLLLWGWWGVLMYNAGWLANPLLIGSVVQVLLKREPRILSTAALACALHSFAVKEYFFNEASGTPIQGLGSAVYVWLTAIACQCLLTWILPRFS